MMKSLLGRVFRRLAAAIDPLPERDTGHPLAAAAAYPPLVKANLHDARLYAERADMIAALGVPPGGIIAEIGVAFGYFSKIMIDTLKPAEFVAIDTFELHHAPVIWGRSTQERLKGLTHEAFYAEQLAGSPARITIRNGISHVRLEEFPDRHFDLIYIDADHTYDAVKADAQVAARKLRPDGVMVFNDYIMFDHVAGAPYGVVPVVNELVERENWRVVGLALHHQMFCDIALRPAEAVRAA